jgi:hypothetical protein
VGQGSYCTCLHLVQAVSVWAIRLCGGDSEDREDRLAGASSHGCPEAGFWWETAIRKSHQDMQSGCPLRSAHSSSQLGTLGNGFSLIILSSPQVLNRGCKLIECATESARDPFHQDSSFLSSKAIHHILLSPFILRSRSLNHSILVCLSAPG